MSALSSPQASASAGPKQISSRLLNMKFMQRAAFAGKTKSSSTPQTPGSEPPLKRRRTGDDFDSNLNSPASYTSNHTPTNTDRFSSALATKAGTDTPLSQDFRSYAGEHYETHWVLDTHSNGHGTHPTDPEPSSEEDDIWASTNNPGVQTYGAFKKKTKTSAPSISKSARRNAAKKHSLDHSDHLSDKSSHTSDSSSNSDSDSNSDSSSVPHNPHESNIYSRDRARAASHKSSSNRPLSTYHPPDDTTTISSTGSGAGADFMRFDRDTSPYNHHPRGKPFDTLSDRKSTSSRSNNTPDRRRGGQQHPRPYQRRDGGRDNRGGGGGKKRKTM